MKITEISPQKNNSLRVNVFVDGTYRFSLDAAEAVLKGIKTGKELSDKDIKNLLMDSDYSKARDTALNILSRKSITSHLLKDAIIQKGYADIIADEVIRELTELGYVDDENYAHMYLEYCREKMWGKKKIRYEMKQKGLSDENIETVLQTYNEDDIISDMAEIIVSKYSACDLGDIKTKAKITRYFASRGFDFSKIDSAINLAKEISGE